VSGSLRQSTPEAHFFILEQQNLAGYSLIDVTTRWSKPSDTMLQTSSHFSILTINVPGCSVEMVQVMMKTAVETPNLTLKNGVFWDVTPCGSCKNRRFGGT
jgi:hypothetical protein